MLQDLQERMADMEEHIEASEETTEAAVTMNEDIREYG